MNKLRTLIPLLLSIFLTSNLISQAKDAKTAEKEPAKSTGTSSPATSILGDREKAAKMKQDFYTKLLRDSNFTPELKIDNTIKLKDISVLRKAALNGKGDVLDVQLNFENLVNTTREYSVFVLALNESTAEVRNSLAPPPVWRNNFPGKGKMVTDFSVLVPAKAREKAKPDDVFKAIWGDEGFKKYKEVLDYDEQKGFNVKLGEPGLEEYAFFLSNKIATEALPFTVYSDEVKKPTDSDYSMSADEQKKDMNDTAAKHSWTIFYSKYKTTVFTHHYSQFRPDFYFFNKIVVLVFDKDKKLIYRVIKDIGRIKEKK